VSGAPIPAELWARIRGFLAARGTGSLTLNVGEGVVTSLEVRERLVAPCSIPAESNGRPPAPRS
jgi:hypothetical protein